MRLAVILSSLAGGGIERMRMHLLQEWARRGISVDLVVSRFEGPLCDQIPNTIRVFEVARRHPLLFPFGLLRYLKTHHPTHILSAGNDINALTLLVTKFYSRTIRTAISFHTQLSRDADITAGITRIKANLVIRSLRLTIANSHTVIAVSNGVAKDLQNVLPIKKQQLHVIYNPVITTETSIKINQPLHNCPVPIGTPWIIFVGRLIPSKGIDILIDAFNLIIDKTNAHLVFLGEGPLESDISVAAHTYNLHNRIHVIGFQKNPLPWIRESNVLVLPSRIEGFGNVLIEGMACGTQIIAADCPSGPAEILDYGKYGQLIPVDDAPALATAILNSLEGRFHVAASLLKKHAHTFSSKNAISLYDAILTGTNIEQQYL